MEIFIGQGIRRSVLVLKLAIVLSVFAYAPRVFAQLNAVLGTVVDTSDRDMVRHDGSSCRPPSSDWR